MKDYTFIRPGIAVTISAVTLALALVIGFWLIFSLGEAARTVTRGAGPAGRPERFDAVRVIRSCLTLERRLLRDRGIELDFATTVESSYLRGDPNALFDVLVNLVRSAAESTGETPSPVTVQLEQKARNLEIVVRGRGGAANLAKARSVTEETFSGTVTVESTLATGTTFTIALPLPPQREGERKT